MSLPEWIVRAKEWPMGITPDAHSDPNGRACGIGCDMGAAGPGPKGQHDPDCEVALFVEAFTIAWEALRRIKVVDVEFKEDLEGLQKAFAAEAMRRIEALGK